MGGGESTKVEVAKRRRQDGNEERGKTIEVYLAQWIGLEHREKYMRGYREAKEGWRFAADAASITDERARSEDRKHTSGGVFVAVDSNLGAVVGAKEGAIDSIPGNEGRIAQVWVNVRGGLRVFSVYFWQSEGWTPRNGPC